MLGGLRESESKSFKQFQVFTVSTGKMITFGLDSRISLIPFSFSLSVFLIPSYLVNPVHITLFPLIFPSFCIYRANGRKFLEMKQTSTPLMTVLAYCECSRRNKPGHFHTQQADKKYDVNSGPLRDSRNTVLNVINDINE